MSARYGSRTRSGEGVSGFGQRGAGGGGGTAEVTASFSPSFTANPLTVDGVEYMVANITGNTTMTVSGPATATAEVFMVAGGGGGGSSPPFGSSGGGGGGGGVINESVTIGPGGPFPIVIGGGGAGSPNPNPTPPLGATGSPTTAFGLTALGGGGGGTPGSPGGCGGGSGATSGFGAGTSSPRTQGFPGGASRPGSSIGAGGGGAGGHAAPWFPGPNPVITLAGMGVVTYLTGSGIGVGGGGAGNAPQTTGDGLPPWPIPTGGGNFVGAPTGTAGGTNQGGGGGFGPAGGNGGSGRVIIRWQRYQG